MGSERGQATVEWIGVVLLLAVGCVALARVAARADAESLGADLAHAITCAAGGSCQAGREPFAARRHRSAPADTLVTAPPLLPVVPAERHRARGRGAAERSRPRSRPRLRLPRLDGRALARARRGAGLLWRRSWMICLGYERARYSGLHPETRFHGHTLDPAEGLRIANDCLSPVDLVRDWDLIQGRP